MTREIEMAYVAGLFEGEGTLSTDPSRPRAQMCMTDREPLERLQAILGGPINGPYQRGGPTHKPIYIWTLHGWDRMEALYSEIAVWLSPRRRAQFEAAIAVAPPPELRGKGCRQRLKTHCPQGHPYDEKNTGYMRETSTGYRLRRCLACHREEGARRYARRRAERDTSSP